LKAYAVHPIIVLEVISRETVGINTEKPPYNGARLISVLLEPKCATQEARFYFLLPPFAAATNR